MSVSYIDNHDYGVHIITYMLLSTNYCVVIAHVENVMTIVLLCESAQQFREL